jgi:predicted ATP-dependent endonuclease of OLD family
MIDKILFSGYKSFKEETELELKPLTILFGKNSAGKSAIAKLPTLIEASLKGKFNEPMRYINNNIELGGEFRDLFYNRNVLQEMSFKLFSGNNFLDIQITSDILANPIITKWETYSEEIVKLNLKISTEEIEKSQEGLFSGFILNNLKSELKEEFSLRTDYVGPFRLNPQRVFHLKGINEFKRLGNKGENAYQILVVNEELAKNVSKWYEDNFDNWGLSIKKIDPYYEIRIKRKDAENDGVNIVDVGQGMSQALPIIVKAHIQNTKPILTILEQPELHLHPAAHGNLAELLTESIKDLNSKYLVETHSENFILRLRRLIAEKKLDKSLINIYWVNYNEEIDSSQLKKININNLGEVDYWPSNIFNENFEEVKALRRAQKEY